MRNQSLGWCGALLGLLLALGAGAAWGQAPAEPPTFEAQLRAAAAAEQTDTLAELMQADRLAVKPVVMALLTESLQAAQASDTAAAAAHQHMAQAIAQCFAEQFGEQSLATAVGYLSRWTPAEQADKLRADSLYAAGTALRGSRDTRPEALVHYQEALALYRTLGDLIGEGTTLGGIGYVNYFLDGEQYLAYNQEALRVRLAADDQELIGNSYGDVGLAYGRFFGDHQQALEHYLQAETVREMLGDTYGLGRTRYSIANTYKALGNIERASVYYVAAAAANAAAGNARLHASALVGAGEVLGQLGRYSEALTLLEEALAIHVAREEPDRINFVLNQMGQVHLRLGDYTAALEALQQVRKQAQAAEDLASLADAQLNIGLVYLFAGRAERAIRFLEEARASYTAIEQESGVMGALTNLGGAHFDLQAYDVAEDYLQQALTLSQTLGFKVDESRILSMLGNTQLYRGNLDGAQDNYEAALVLGEVIGSHDLLLVPLIGLGEHFERREDYPLALNYYEQAFAVLEANRTALQGAADKAGFLSQQRYLYEAVLHLLGRLHEEDPTGGYDALAFDYAERAKARAFLDLLAESLAGVQEGVSPALRAEEANLVAAITETQLALKQDDPDTAVLRTQLDSLETAYGTLKRTLREQNPRYAELQYPQPNTLAEVQSALLDDETVLLEYAVGDSSTVLWAVTAEERQLYRLPGRDVIQGQVERLRAALTDPATPATRFAALSHRLYETLLAPAQALVAQAGHLIVIPDGVLHYLPFEALLTAAPADTAGYGALPYLIRQHAVSYGQSASVLYQLQQQDRPTDRPRKDLLAFGDPVFVDQGAATLERLPFSGDEVRHIAALFAEDRADVFFQDQATEAQLKALDAHTDYRYLHLATHGLVDEDQPDFSSVALAAAEGTGEDGFLRAAEIFNLRLNADMVVLSACETGLGKMVRGEGIVGLSRAFMYAGAPALVVSLWSVADASTAELMTGMYTELVASDHQKARSLRNAKVALLEDERFAHPFHWAPFILIGTWQ